MTLKNLSASIQADGYSLDARKEKTHKYAEYEDMAIVDEHSEMKIA